MSSARRHAPGRTIPLGWDEEPEADAVTTPPPAPGTGEGPTGPGGGARPRRRRTLVVAGGVAALLVLVIALPMLLMNPRTPERAAREYLDALVAGDATTLRALSTVPEGVSDAALQDAVLQGAERRVRDYSVDGVSVAGDMGTVAATLELGPDESPQPMTLDVRAERSGPLHRRSWVLDPVVLGEAQVAVPVGATALTLGGAEVPVAPVGTDDGAEPMSISPLAVVRLALPPGRYEAALAGGGEDVTPGLGEVDVAVDGRRSSRPSITLQYMLTPQGHARISALVTEQVEQCAGSRSAHPEDCAVALPGRADPAETGRWEVLEAPEVVAVPWVVGSWSLTTTTEGRARFTPDDPGSPVQEVPVQASGLAFLDEHQELAVSLFPEGEAVQITTCVDPDTGAMTGLEIVGQDAGSAVCSA